MESSVIYLGCDAFGEKLKDHVKEHLAKVGGKEIVDVGTDSYYCVASQVGQEVGAGKGVGILFCGSGMGVAIVANKHPKVYAAVVENVEAAQNSRSINNSNVLTMGGMITSPEKAVEIVDAWIQTPFVGPCPLNKGEGWDDSTREFLTSSMKESEMPQVCSKLATN